MTTWMTTVVVQTDGVTLDEQQELSAVLRAAVMFNADDNTLTVNSHTDSVNPLEAGQVAIRAVREALGKRVAVLDVRMVTFGRLERELAFPDPADLIGLAESAEVLGVSRQRVAELAGTHKDFPAPLARIAAGPIFTRASIESFNGRWERKRTGRPRKAS